LRIGNELWRNEGGIGAAHFDNIDLSLLPALRGTLALSEHADFCDGGIDNQTAIRKKKNWPKSSVIDSWSVF
jgi:hypothetical protein